MYNLVRISCQRLNVDIGTASDVGYPILVLLEFSNVEHGQYCLITGEKPHFDPQGSSPEWVGSYFAACYVFYW